MPCAARTVIAGNDLRRRALNTAAVSPDAMGKAANQLRPVIQICCRMMLITQFTTAPTTQIDTATQGELGPG